MKKVFFVMLLFCSMATVSMAQPRAIGGRVGYNIEFSYQHAIGARNMLDISAGATNVWNGWAYTEANCMYDWIIGIGSSKFNFYLGPGAGIGYAYGRFWNKYDYSPLRVNVGGQFGFEYQFDIPLNLSIDWRPMVNVLGFRHDDYPIYNSFYNFAVGVRYRF